MNRGDMTTMYSMKFTFIHSLTFGTSSNRVLTKCEAARRARHRARRARHATHTKNKKKFKKYIKKYKKYKISKNAEIVWLVGFF